jgi:hypothetical protein
MTSKVTYLGKLRTSSIHIQFCIKIISDVPLDNKGKGEAFTNGYRCECFGKLHDDRNGNESPLIYILISLALRPRLL